MPVFRGERRRLRPNQCAQKQRDERNARDAPGPEWHFVNYYTPRKRNTGDKIRIGRSAAGVTQKTHPSSS